MPTEIQLQSALLLEAPRVLTSARLFRRNVGAARFKGHVVQFGIPGQCDLYAITRASIHVEVELKLWMGRLRPAQIEWKSFCESWGVRWVLLQSWKQESVDQTVRRWIYELQSSLNG